MKKIVTIAIVFLSVLMFVSLYPTRPVNAAPRSDLDIIWYTSSDSAYTALVTDEVDMIQWALTKEQKEAVELNPNLQIASYVENGMMEFDLNNNLTIADYPTSRSPTSCPMVRIALAYMTNKDYIINTILENFGSRLDAPVCYPQTQGWVDPSVVTFDFNGNGVIDPSEDNYPYKYNINDAANALVLSGFNDTDGNGYLNYPINATRWLDAAGKDTTEMPLKICIRADHVHRREAGRWLYHQLEGDPGVAGDGPLASATWPTRITEYLGHGDGVRTQWKTTHKPKVICTEIVRVNGVQKFKPADYQIMSDGTVIFTTALPFCSSITIEYDVNIKGGDFDTTDELWVKDRATLRTPVMGEFNYHIYTGGWSFGRFPTYLFSLFHSMFSYPYGPNYVTGDGTYPYYDAILEKIYYAANLADAQNASKWATNFHVNNVVNIPLWSYTSYVGWRKELAGVVNMKGYGTVNDWTFLNAWRVKTGDPLRFACVSSWDILNIMYSQWFFEYALLDRVYSGLINVNPYDLAQDIPWAAQDWEVGTWIDPRTGTTKQKVTYWLRRDVGAAAPVTGDFAGFFSAGSCEYTTTVWYNYAFDDDWQWSNFMDVHHTEIVDNSQIVVYFDDVSMWFVYAPIYPLLGPAPIVLDQLCEKKSATLTGADLVESPPGYFEYQFTPYQVVVVINATVNGVPMYEGTDFYIRAGYDVYCHNVFVPLRAFAPTDVITIAFWTPVANGAGGTYLGGNLGYDWTDTMYAYGYHYPVSISTTSAALNKNPYFQLETIPKGEIDFRWYWAAGAKPRKGNFKIDILDVVKCTGSYCTRGDGIFNPVYLPGADLDDTDVCHIGILDLVTITGKYANTFGRPPA